MDTKVLTQIGLTESEVKVYFALLELESSPVGPIIEKAKVQDSKIYSILEKLKEKGLVSFVIKNNVKHFQAADPGNLLRIINEKEQQLSDQKRELEDKIIPEIEERKKFKEEKQEATVYEGFEGLRSAFNVILETLRKGEEYQVFTLGDELGRKEVISFFNNYHKKRIDKGITARLISQKKSKNVIEKEHRYQGMRILYTNRLFPVGTFIFKDHVMTVVWGEKPAAFIVKSRKNYGYQKEFFESLWKIAKK